MVRLVPNGAPKCTETDLKKSQICPIWGQSDPIWTPNLTTLHRLCSSSLPFDKQRDISLLIERKPVINHSFRSVRLHGFLFITLINSFVIDHLFNYILSISFRLLEKTKKVEGKKPKEVVSSLDLLERINNAF